MRITLFRMWSEFWARIMVLAIAALAGVGVAPAHAGCGCDKPAPARAAVRPFVAWADQTIMLFDERLDDGKKFVVKFENTATGHVAWSKAKAKRKKDQADRATRDQLRVKVPAIPVGPVRISVYKDGPGSPFLYALTDTQFTVTAPPVALHDFEETISRPNCRAGVGRDGTIYVAVDVSQVSDATRFTATALGLPASFEAQNVAMYNDQGFLMQLLDPSIPGLFSIYAGDDTMSTTLSYWRHEFRTYKEEHRLVDAFGTDDDADHEWHANGTPHIEHDRIIVAVRGTTPAGGSFAPGATPPFRLVIMSSPEER